MYNVYSQILKRISPRRQSGFENPGDLPFRQAMQKAKAFEQDAGAAASGDPMARIRLVGRDEQIKRDLAQSGLLKEFLNNTFRQQFASARLWTA